MNLQVSLLLISSVLRRHGVDWTYINGLAAYQASDILGPKTRGSTRLYGIPRTPYALLDARVLTG